MECTDTAEEQRVHSPPASLVPRIHVVLAHKLQHINPLLPACLNKEESKTCKCKCWSHRLVPSVGAAREARVRTVGPSQALLIAVSAHCPLWEFSSLKWARGEYLNCLILKIGTSYWPTDKSVLVVYWRVLFVPPVYFFNLRHLCWFWIWPPFLLQLFQVSCPNCLQSEQNCLGSSLMPFWEIVWLLNTLYYISSLQCKCSVPGGNVGSLCFVASGKGSRVSEVILCFSLLGFIIKWFLFVQCNKCHTMSQTHSFFDILWVTHLAFWWCLFKCKSQSQIKDLAGE